MGVLRMGMATAAAAFTCFAVSASAGTRPGPGHQGLRDQQVERDVQAILQGMAHVRAKNERLTDLQPARHP
jgi:hypothetical protein